MEKTYTIKAQCSCCGRKSTIVGYEKVAPNELLEAYIKIGGKCPVCRELEFIIL